MIYGKIKKENQCFQFWQRRSAQPFLIGAEQILLNTQGVSTFLRGPSRGATRITDQYAEFLCTDSYLRLGVHASSNMPKAIKDKNIDLIIAEAASYRITVFGPDSTRLPA